MMRRSVRRSSSSTSDGSNRADLKQQLQQWLPYIVTLPPAVFWQQHLQTTSIGPRMKIIIMSAEWGILEDMWMMIMLQPLLLPRCQSDVDAAVVAVRHWCWHYEQIEPAVVVAIDVVVIVILFFTRRQLRHLVRESINRSFLTFFTLVSGYNRKNNFSNCNHTFCTHYSLLRIERLYRFNIYTILFLHINR